jgi:hypothetical protein
VACGLQALMVATLAASSAAAIADRVFMVGASP